MLDKTHKGWWVTKNVLKPGNSLGWRLPILNLVIISLAGIRDGSRWVLGGLFEWIEYDGREEGVDNSISIVRDMELGITSVGKIGLSGSTAIWCMRYECVTLGREFKFWTFKSKGNERGIEDVPKNWLFVWLAKDWHLSKRGMCFHQKSHFSK